MSKKSTFKTAIQWFLIFSGAIVLAVALRVIVFDSYTIPSWSMSPSVHAGDYILVNKLIPGTRFFENYDFLKNGKRPEIWRMKGMGAIERNDVLVFNFPYTKRNKIQPDMNVYYVKRCVAIPGDTFYIDNGFYKVKNCVDTLGNYNNQKKLSLRNDSTMQPDVFKAFPKNSKYYDWNLKNFGPLYVPKQKDCLAIDSINVVLYQNLIEYETAKQIRIQQGEIFLNDSLITKYTFEMNYYFMTGDHVLDSRDSRYWGLLPEDHIVGKAFMVWKSVDTKTNNIRWDRILKLIK